MKSFRLRRVTAAVVCLLMLAVFLAKTPVEDVTAPTIHANDTSTSEMSNLNGLLVKGRAPKTGYSRGQFGDGWEKVLGCDTRNRILARDLKNVVTNEECKVMSGTLHDPYTGKVINFIRGESTSDDVQIDHVVALSNAWQTGAQQLTFDQRVALANDPLNLLAVDGNANQQKSDGDAATWLPSNKAFRCQYGQRQVSVKKKYQLWITPAEKQALINIIANC